MVLRTGCGDSCSRAGRRRFRSGIPAPPHTARHVQSTAQPYDYTSPLSSMRSYIKDHRDDTLLTITNLPAGTPVRLAVMDWFDGSVWNLSDSSKASDCANYQRVGTTISTDERGMHSPPPSLCTEDSLMSGFP